MLTGGNFWMVIDSHGLPVPDCLQGQQPPPLALGLMPVVELLPQFPVFGGKALDADFSVHDTLL
jgi:hypothetical protein